MLATIAAILPIFALIGAGWAGRRLDIFSAATQAELTRFVVRLALPVLLFGIVAEAHPSEIWQPRFVLAYSIGCLGTFVLAILLRVRRVGMADAIIDGLSAAFTNAAFLGIPLALALFGPPGLLAASIGAIITSCVLFALAILLVEIALQPGAGRLALLGKALIAAARNPLVFAPALGAVLSLAHIDLPVPAIRFVDLLGAAASPCALVSLGMFLAEKRPAIRWGGVAELSLLKLVAQPALTFLAVYAIAPQPPFWAKAAILLSAMPTGTGPFMLAELYGRETDIAARTILVSTTLSIVTITLLMSWL